MKSEKGKQNEEEGRGGWRLAFNENGSELSG
jgi:hypothetical protein